MSQIRYRVILCFLIFVSCRKKVEAPVVPDPIACFNLPSNFQKPNTSIQFANCSENFDSVEWDFGDGFKSPILSPSHQYTTTGVYNVNLKVFKANKVNSISKKIAIATQVEMDFTVLMKNFKGGASTSSFVCKYSAVNSKQIEQVFFNLNYPAINNPNYTISSDMSGLYFGNDPNVKHRFKVVGKNLNGVIDSLLTDEIDIVESANYINKNVKLNFCEVDYTINLRYQ